ncbi:MAG TPA: hypothetical protein VFC17_09885 [Candidatus Limnocylindrales bacterium]|jgi:hypothetical protein|nr:hypothetical protein [Candidatus Limnocylindrales bacterium]
MKNKSETIKRPLADKSPERLKRLKELNERVRGSMPNFMTQEDLRKMREDEKWETIHQTQGR